MVTINLLHIHIVSCKNLQLMMRWWLWFTLRDFLQELWGSYTLDIHVPIEFWEWLLPLAMSRYTKRFRYQCGFQWVGLDSFLCMCIFRSTLITVDLWGQFYLHHHGSDLMHKCQITTTTMALLRCFVGGDYSVQPGHALTFVIATFTGDECFQTEENDGDITPIILVIFYFSYR